jgi:hypothetical protein
MSITIKSATWGDEKSTTNITDSMVAKAKDGYLDLVADNSLVPAIDLLSGSKTIVLSDSEKTQMNEDAVKICGGAQDNKCIAFQKNQLESSLLQRKVAESQSSANIVTGRRLTLTIIDSTGKEKVIAIPDGQKVKLGDKPAIVLPTTLSGGVWEGLVQLFGIASTIVITIFYVVSIVAPYALFVRDGQWVIGIALSIVAIFLPFTGLVTTPIAFAILRSRQSAKVVPIKE